MKIFRLFLQKFFCSEFLTVVLRSVFEKRHFAWFGKFKCSDCKILDLQFNLDSYACGISSENSNVNCKNSRFTSVAESCFNVKISGGTCSFSDSSFSFDWNFSDAEFKFLMQTLQFFKMNLTQDFLIQLKKVLQFGAM